MKTTLLCLTLVAFLSFGLTRCAPITPPATPPPPSTSPPVLPSQVEIPDVGEKGAVPLTGDWRYQVVPMFTPELAAPEFDDGAWATVQAPAPWPEQGLGDRVGAGDVVVYRRQVDVPPAWAGQPIGISAWANPFGAQVFVNGQRVEPLRTPFAPYGDITALITPGSPATIALVTQFDGALAYADAGAPRLGPLGTRKVAEVLREQGGFPTPDGDAEYTLARPGGIPGPLPTLLLTASGSHGMAEMTAWADVADDLARAGYATVAIAPPAQNQAALQAALDFLKQQSFVDPGRLYVYAVDQAAVDALAVAAAEPAIRGLIVLSPPMLQKLPDLGGRPLLLMATAKDRGGLIVNQLKKLAGPLGANAQVVELPGDGHGTFVLTNVWNAVRQAVLEWLADR
jgi:dienelactone hydrolase